jgi:hypothetical protein
MLRRKKPILALLEPGVLLVDDVPLAPPDDDLAVLGTSLDAASNFHRSPSWINGGK